MTQHPDLTILGDGDNESRAGHPKDCRQCVCWFLGCLNGREKWKDPPIRPNFRHVGASGKVYLGGYWKLPESEQPSPDEFPLRQMCDAFEWDPDPARQGRAVGG